MNQNENKFTDIPAAACCIANPEAITLGQNGENAKTAPIKMLARSSKPIEHWYWGRVIHDMAGMHLHKSRLPIDYVHDSGEIIGYLNHFENKPEGMEVSGALVPYKENDRANEIIFKMSQGVPYEASINFGGDGIKIQEINEGDSVEVNGFVFQGPGIVIREWPLRGVAVCPYGADMNTNSKTFESSKTFKAEKFNPIKETDEMKQTPEEAEKPVEVALAESAPAPVEAPVVATEELKAEPVETPTPEPVMEKVLSISEKEFDRMISEFGIENAVCAFRNGGGYEAAKSAHYEQLKVQLAQVAQVKTVEVKPVTFAEPTAKKTLAQMIKV